MKPEDADAVARFVQEGGEVRKVTGAIPASEGDVLAYLAECGLDVKIFTGDIRPYLCNGRRHSAEGLLRIANTRRAADQLAPFMLGRHVSAASRSVQGDQFNPG